ncbi:MAG TPA: aminotransferase class V-fold PLP-dependent enzyme, partial [Thermoanaerobaculia bacterium]
YGAPVADRERRVATVSFAVDGRPAGQIPPHFDRQRIGIRYGDFQSRRLIESLGLAGMQGVVRVSMAHYNTEEEIDRLIAGLDEIL